MGSLADERPRLLIVDDDDAIQTMLGRAAQAAGMAAHSLTEGNRALQIALDEKPDLILLDIEMPSADGRDILRDLKRDPRTEGIPVFMYTGRDSPHDRRLALELGAEKYFEKPFDLGALMRRIIYRLEKLGRAPRPELEVSRSAGDPSSTPHRTDDVLARWSETPMGDDGLCEHCDQQGPIRLMLHVASGSLRWLCAECRTIASSHWRGAGTREIDRRQIAILRLEEHERSSSLTTRAPSPSQRPVLVVEDDEDIRDGICELLAGEGVPTIAASNGQEALDVLRSQPAPPSLILLDLMMPVMDGWELHRRIRSEGSFSRTPIVVMSARPPDDRLRARAWLQKPLGVERLLSTVREAVAS